MSAEDEMMMEVVEEMVSGRSDGGKSIARHRERRSNVKSARLEEEEDSNPESSGDELIAREKERQGDVKSSLEDWIDFIQVGVYEVIEDTEDITHCLQYPEGVLCTWIVFMKQAVKMGNFVDFTGKNAQDVINAILDPSNVVDQDHCDTLRGMVQETLRRIASPWMNFCQSSLEILNNKDVLEKNLEILADVYHNLKDETRKDDRLFALAVCNGLSLQREDRQRLKSEATLRAYPPVLPHMDYQFKVSNRPAVTTAIHRGGALRTPGTLSELPEPYRKNWRIVMRGINDDPVDVLLMLNTWITRYITGLDSFGQPRATHVNGAPNPQLAMVGEIREQLTGPSERHKVAIACLLMKKNKNSPFLSLPEALVRNFFEANGYDPDSMFVWGTDFQQLLVNGITVDEMKALLDVGTFNELVRLHGVPSM